MVYVSGKLTFRDTANPAVARKAVEISFCAKAISPGEHGEFIEQIREALRAAS